MITSTEIVTLTRQIISNRGTDALYAQPLQEVAHRDTLNSLLSRAENMPPDSLADTLVDSLEIMEEADVLVEEIIEHVGNSSTFTDFSIIAEDEDLSEHIPIYLLEAHGAF